MRVDERSFPAHHTEENLYPYWIISSLSAMKILGDTETINMSKKLLKPQVERRRRERMNRSLENLRTLLLQGPEHNSPTQRRLEKAEILEYTVMFLQNSAQGKKAKGMDAGEKRQFMDGFSSCLQKASRFLLEEGEARGLEGPVTSALCQRLAQPCMSTTFRLPSRIQNSSRMQNAQHHQRQPPQQNSVCKQGLPSTCRNTVPQSNRIAFRSTDSNTLHTTARPTSQHQAPASQTVWRPWP